MGLREAVGESVALAQPEALCVTLVHGESVGEGVPVREVQGEAEKEEEAQLL